MTFKKTFYGIPLAYNMVSAGCEILIWGIQNYSGASFCFKYFQKLHLTTVDFFPKIFLILYPSLENTTISVALVHLAFFSIHNEGIFVCICTEEPHFEKDIQADSGGLHEFLG